MRFHGYILLAGLAASLLQGVALADALPQRGLSLPEVDRLVAERNRTLINSRRASSAAEAGIDIAGGRPNPVISLNTSGINSRRPTGSGNLDTVLRIDQPIERGGKRELRLAVADNILAASRSDEADSLRLQRALARQAYFDLKASEDKARFGSESAQLAQQILAKAELRLKAGDLSPADVARLRTDSLRAQSDATQARVDLQRARLALAQLLALESEAPRIATTDPWPQLAPLPLVPEDIERRPDVVAAHRRLDSAEEAIRLAKSQQTRDVTIGAQIERDNQVHGSNLLGVGISIPLFTGYDYRGEIRQAYVARDIADDELQRVQAMAAAEAAQFTMEADRLGERARLLRDEALPAARKATAAVQLAFEHGAASVLDLIDARRSLHAVETDTASALADAAKARTAWAAALNHQELP